MLFDGLKGRRVENYELKNLTTWRVGGPADEVYWPETIEDLVSACDRARKAGIPLWLLGRGSNVLAPDAGLNGLVIVTTELKGIKWEDCSVIAEAGCSLARLAQEAGGRGLAGLEFARGIPGTVGGALIMNAGAHGGEIGKWIDWVKTVTMNGEIKVFHRDDLKFGYRESSLKGEGYILETRLTLLPGDKEKILAIMAEYQEHRKKIQPLDKPNAGSVFRNPSHDSAGRLIEQAGWKGKRVGGAQVSEKHANFIINAGNASAEDILALMKNIQTDVFEKFGVQLRSEVLYLT